MILDTLNPAQRAFVLHDTGAALGVAGPGAGKTHSMTVRCARLIEDGMFPGAILLMTFTNKAAAEIKRRCYTMIGESAKGIHAGTFHGIALRSLSRAKQQVYILGTGETHDIMNGVRKDFGLTKDHPSSKDFLSMFGLAANTDVPIRDVMRLPSISVALAETIFSAYTDAKRDLGGMDYDDLLVTWRNLLRDDPEFRDSQQNKYRRIMVDEFQDTNPLQMQIIRLLADDESNVVVVGDEWQSIYAFRGAQVQNILLFEREFPGSARYDMTQNYRSRNQIISAANALMGRAKERLADKTLTGTRGDGDPVTVVRCMNELDEADYIVKQIRAWRDANHYLRWHDIAVIYRSSFHALRLELALTTARIPYVKCGGRKVTDSKHIRDLLACLWVLINPKQRVAWQRVLMMIEGIGAKTASNVAGILCASDDPGVALAHIKVAKKSEPRLRDMGEWYRLAKWSNAEEAVAEAWGWYDPFFQEEFGESEAFRESGLKAMYDFAGTFDNPFDFLNEFVLDEDPMREEDEQRDKLVITTTHSVKGREFDSTVVMRCNYGFFPSYKEESEEEGRRLFYVALTRAKERVVCTYVEKTWNGDHEQNAFPSELLRDIPNTRHVRRADVVMKAQEYEDEVPF